MKPHLFICIGHVQVWESSRERFSKLFPPVLNLDPTPYPLIALFGITGRDYSLLTPYKHCSLSFASLLARRAVLL